jgi:predicted nucleic acid-binding protein
MAARWFADTGAYFALLENDELRDLHFFLKYADQCISFTDCLSFVVMKNHRVKRVFTFDRHFAYAGFEIISKR